MDFDIFKVYKSVMEPDTQVLNVKLDRTRVTLFEEHTVSGSNTTILSHIMTSPFYDVIVLQRHL